MEYDKQSKLECRRTDNGFACKRSVRGGGGRRSGMGASYGSEIEGMMAGDTPLAAETGNAQRAKDGRLRTRGALTESRAAPGTGADYQTYLERKRRQNNSLVIKENVGRQGKARGGRQTSDGEPVSIQRGDIPLPGIQRLLKHNNESLRIGNSSYGATVGIMQSITGKLMKNALNTARAARRNTLEFADLQAAVDNIYGSSEHKVAIARDNAFEVHKSKPSGLTTVTTGKAVSSIGHGERRRGAIPLYLPKAGFRRLAEKEIDGHSTIRISEAFILNLQWLVESMIIHCANKAVLIMNKEDSSRVTIYGRDLQLAHELHHM